MLAEESLWPEVVRLLSSAESAYAPLQLLLALTSFKDPEVCDALWALLGIWSIVPRLFVLVNANPGLAEGSLLVLGNLCGAGAYLPTEVRSLSTARSPGDSKYTLTPPPQPFAAILKAAQRRANGELGTIESDHDCSGGQAAMVTHRQRETRQACLANAGELLPALCHQYGPQAMLAALRVAQMLLRDGGNIAAAREVVLRSSCEWVDLVPTLDAVSVVIALDVLSVLVSASNSPLFQKGVRAACSLIQASDAFVSQKALETVHKCSQHICYHALIASIVLAPSLAILRSTLDLVQSSQRLQTAYAGPGGEAQQVSLSAARQRGQAMSRTALSILRTLVGNEAIARAASQAGFVQTFISALSNAFPLHTADAGDEGKKSPFYAKVARESFSLPPMPPNNAGSLDAEDDARDVADAFMDVFCVLASHTSLRQALLSFGSANVLLRLVEVVFAKDAQEGVVPLMSRLPSSPSHGAHDALSIQSAFGPLSRRAIEALYFLSTHEGDELADALRAPGSVDVCRYLVFAWAYGGEDISSMAVTILMRCGARGAACHREIRSVPDDGFLATVASTESGALPWAYLVQEHMICLLSEMVSGAGSALQRASLERRTAGLAVLSPETVLFCQSAACACLRAVLGENEDFRSETSPGIPPLDVSLSPVQRAFLELCAEHGLMLSLEALALRSLDAAMLQGDLFCWRPEAATFRWAGPSFFDSVLCSLHAFDTLSSTIPAGSALQAVRILAAALQHSDDSRARVLAQTMNSREATSLALQKIMNSDVSSTWPGGGSSRKVLIMCTVVIHGLFDFSHGVPEASESEAAVLSWTCGLVIDALSPAVKLVHETGRVEADPDSQPLWEALCLFSRERRCSEALLPADGGALALVLPLLGIATSAAVVEPGPDAPLLVALQHTESILIGLTANAEARVAESLASNASNLAVITRFVSLLKGGGSEVEAYSRTAEALVQLLHAWSCSSIALCGCLVQGEEQPFVRLCVQGVTESCMTAIAAPGEQANCDYNHFCALEVRLALLANLCRCPQGRGTIFFLAVEALRALPALITAKADDARACTALSAAMTLHQALAPLLHQSYGAASRDGLLSLHPSLTPEHCRKVNALCPPTFLACLAVCTRAADLVLVEQSLSVCLLLAGHGDVFASLRQSTTLDAAAAVLQRLLPTVASSSDEGPAGRGGASQEETTLRSLACDKCLRLVQHCLRAIAVDGSGSQEPVSLAGRDLVANTLRVLMGAPRTMDNLPAILRAGEVLQQLVLDEFCSAEFQELKQNRNRVQIMPGSTLKESPAALLDTVLVINSLTQAQKIPASRPAQMKRMNV